MFKIRLKEIMRKQIISRKMSAKNKTELNILRGVGGNVGLIALNRGSESIRDLKILHLIYIPGY